MLVISVEPIPGESVPGLIARAAAENYYTSVRDVLIQSSIDTPCPENVTSKSPALAAVLAKTLGTDKVDLIAAMFKTPISSKPGWHDFFGVPLRNFYRETLCRRVSPRALRISAHARAIWSVKVLSFDPQTKEILIDSCPACRKTLGWGHTRGIAFCEHCTRIEKFGEWNFERPAVDFRDYPQSIVEIEDQEALDFVVGLIDPDSTARTRFRHRVPEVFHGIDRGELFEFVVALACIFREPKARLKNINRRNPHFTPEILALAGRTVLDWPKSFGPLASIVRATSPVRSGYYSNWKDFGQVDTLTRDKRIAERLQILVKKEMVADIGCVAGLPKVRRGASRTRTDLITANEVDARYRIPRKILPRLIGDPRVTTFRESQAEKSPILFVDREIAVIAAARRELLRSSQVAALIGIPKETLPDFERRNFITREDGPVMHLVDKARCYRRASVEGFIASVRTRIAKGDPPARHVGLGGAMNALPPGQKPWGGVFQAIMEGRLPVHHMRSTSGGLANTLAVSSVAEIAAKISKDGQNETAALSNGGFLTPAAAASMLSTTMVNVYALLRAGLISRVDAKGLRRVDIIYFIKCYMFTGEIMVRMDVHRYAVRTSLAAERIFPAYTLDSGKLVWRRDEVERFLSGTVNRSE